MYILTGSITHFSANGPISEDPSTTITDVVNNDVTLQCSFKTLPASSTDYLYEVHWYNGDFEIVSETVESSAYTADALYNTTMTFGTEVTFKDGVIMLYWLFLKGVRFHQ